MRKGVRSVLYPSSPLRGSTVTGGGGGIRVVPAVAPTIAWGDRQGEGEKERVTRRG